jgi:peptidoglycan/LPS O-acetylase OafA/YrhL
VPARGTRCACDLKPRLRGPDSSVPFSVACGPLYHPLAPAGLKHRVLSSLIKAMSQASARMGHVPVLDGFRALAIIVVMVAHAGAGKVIPGGFGVTIFFFLSGYLITTLMRVEATRTGSIDLRDFYLRRSIRILPPLYVTAALTAFLTVSGLIAAKLTFGSVVLDGLFLTNYAQQFPASFNHPLSMPLWSLDVEEHFYIILSTLFAAVFVRWSPRRAAAACAIGCVAVLGIRLFNVIALPDYSLNYYWSHTRLDSILFASGNGVVCTVYGGSPGCRRFAPNSRIHGTEMDRFDLLHALFSPHASVCGIRAL